MKNRIQNQTFLDRIMTANDAAAMIRNGDIIATSGFTGAGYPKAVPEALAQRIEEAHSAGSPFTVRLLTGASTGPQPDGALASVGGVAFRCPYNGDTAMRARIN